MSFALYVYLCVCMCVSYDDRVCLVDHYIHTKSILLCGIRVECILVRVRYKPRTKESVKPNREALESTIYP